jgi:hypothetical protein
MKTYPKDVPPPHGRDSTRTLLTAIGLLLMSTVAAAIWLTVPSASISHRQAAHGPDTSVNVTGATGEVDQSNLSATPAVAVAAPQ